MFLKAVFGIALYPDDSTDSQQLMKFAEIAASRSREQKNSSRMMYSSAMNDMAQEQLKLNTALRKALDNNEFTVAYQPQIDVLSGQLIGAEASRRITRLFFLSASGWPNRPACKPNAGDSILAQLSGSGSMSRRSSFRIHR